ncbi:related to calpain-like protease PalBory [Melanopsichium pennsylvanicum]|uniref:Related to calpain-like protease PalBory n=1 Tax=Melanopsichium pennsylvanicum TaxID=63383 RepID=A0AAJ4XR59_9BASI|nr:related to calpain-like protease PalBory [Melanopsichium pennsylvanicum]
MGAPITRADWEGKLKHAQDQAHRATKAELARDYSEAFELYVRAGQLFIWLLGNFPSPNNAASIAATQGGASSSRLGSGSSSPISADGFSGSAAAQLRERLKQMATKVMARAEKIKAIRKDLRPVDRDALSEEEQLSILVASSLINGRSYPIWNGVTFTSSLAPASKTCLSERPALSPAQLRKGAVYKRFSQIDSADSQGWGKRLRGSDIVQDIVTDCSFVAALEVAAEHDHLFGGQLATCALHPQDSEGRIQFSTDGQYHVKLHINGTPRIVSIDDHLPYYPPDAPNAEAQASNSHTLSAEGDRLMCATSRSGQVTWPALLEKAYLKVMGGYDFVGSNGSIDLYALTGWLPEHMFLRHAGFQREKTWNRFHVAWRAGRCMATVGTGKAQSRNAGQADEGLATILLESGLVSSHNYAILDVLERGSRRYVKLMNPWRTAAGIRPAIAISVKEELSIYENGISIEDQLESVRMQDNEEQDSLSFTFTVTWDDLCSHFDSLFLNWDSKLFDNSVAVHSSWRCGSAEQSSSASSTTTFKQPDRHFRLSVSVPSSMLSDAQTVADPSAEVWLFLTRHITSTQTTKGKAHENATQPSTEYIALHVFEDDQHTTENGGQSVSALVLRKAKHMGTYVDGTHSLVRLKLAFLRERARRHQEQQSQQQQSCSFTVVVSRRCDDDDDRSAWSRILSSEDAGKDVNYTLSVYSCYQLSLSELRTRLPYGQTLTGTWTVRTAGGNATLASFMSNPQYTLTIPPGSDDVQVHIVLESSDRRIPVQVLLTYPGSGSSTGRVTYLTEGDVVLSSGMYHHGLALCSSTSNRHGGLRAGGQYTLIVSTFEAGIKADYRLCIESTSRVKLRSIPLEGAGMFHRRLNASWKSGVNAFGSQMNSRYFDNPTWMFTTPIGQGVLDLVARLKVERLTMGMNELVRPYVNLALFRVRREDQHGGREGVEWEQVANSGGYTDLVCGTVIDEARVKLEPGTVYGLVASTLQPDTEAEFSIELYTSAKVHVVTTI